MKRLTLTQKSVKLYKAAIVLGMTMLGLMLLFPLFALLTVNVINDEVLYFLFCLVTFLMCASGTVVFVFPFLFDDPNKIMSRKSTADRYDTGVTSYETFLSDTDVSLKDKAFERIIDKAFVDYELVLFSKERATAIDFVLIIRSKEFTEEILERSQADYVECVEAHYQRKYLKLSSHITVSTVVCVDRVTSSFKSLVNGNIEQDFKITRFVSGLSFGGKKLYVAKQKGGLAFLRYKKLKKKFFDMFSFLFNNI